MNKATGITAGAAKSSRLRRMAATGLLAACAAAALPALAQPAPPPPPPRPPMGMGMDHGMHGGMGGMGMGMGMMGSPERMGRMIDHMLDGLNASDAQRTQIKQIVASAAADIKTQMGAGRGLRQRGMQIFTAPTVDAGAAEQLRQQALQQHDQMSRRVTQAMVEVARVLTPEQRAKIGERMRDRQARMEERRQRMERDMPRR